SRLQDGDGLSVHPPEHPPLLPLPRVRPPDVPLDRRVRCRVRPAGKHGPPRPRRTDLLRQRHPPDGLLALLSLAPARGRRPARLLLLHASPAGPLRRLATDPGAE